MTTKLQENKTKGNNANNIALVNNIVQANSEINNDISLNNKVEIKSGFFNFVKAYIGKKYLDLLVNIIIMLKNTNTNLIKESKKYLKNALFSLDCRSLGQLWIIYVII